MAGPERIELPTARFVTEMKAGDLFYVPPEPYDFGLSETNPMCRCISWALPITPGQALKTRQEVQIS